MHTWVSDQDANDSTERSLPVNGDRNLALFCDFENIALGARDAKYASFDIQQVLHKLLLKGSILESAAQPAQNAWLGHAIGEGRLASAASANHNPPLSTNNLTHTRRRGVAGE